MVDTLQKAKPREMRLLVKDVLMMMLMLDVLIMKALLV